MPSLSAFGAFLQKNLLGSCRYSGSVESEEEEMKRQGWRRGGEQEKSHSYPHSCSNGIKPTEELAGATYLELDEEKEEGGIITINLHKVEIAII